MATTRIKTLDLQTLIDAEKGPIWARNRSSQVISPGGDVFISVNIQGSQRVVNVPSTWIPINLTSQVPRKALLESPYFMEALTKGLIDVISETDAAAMLEREGAQEEIQRLAERARSIKEAINNRGIGRNVTVVNSNRDEEEDAVSPEVSSLKKVSVVRLDGDDEEEEAQEEVSAGFKAWVNKLNTMTAKEASSAFKSRGSISYEEAVFLVAKLKHRTLASRVSQKLNLGADSED